MIEMDEALCPCGHPHADHHFGCEALPDEGCPCTAVYPADGSAPWLPPGLRLPRVGDRVRVRLSGECRKPPDPASEQARTGVGQGHARFEDGLTGVVFSTEATRPVARACGHIYAVRWDVPPPHVRAVAAHYAAIELELLSDDDAE